MFWSSVGAQNILALRLAILSNRFDAYWKQRNDSLAQAA